MKNFGISTKKFVRKITAIASATLMAGLSMGAATADLSSLSGTFIQNGELNAYVVVGTGGQANVVGFAKDVAGSIVVASAFAQQAKTTAATSGSATLSRNVTTGYLNGSYLGFGGSVPTTSTTWTNADSGFNWLPNTTVANTTSSEYANVTGKLTAAANSFYLDKAGNYTINSEALVYNLTFNSDRSTSGNKAIGNGTQGIPFPDGKSYQITNYTYASAGLDGINLTLGDYTSVTTTKGQVNTVGSTGITFEVIEAYTSPENKLQVKVLSSSGTVLFNDKVSKGDVIYEGSGITLLLSDYGVSVGSGVSATIQWTTSSKVLRQGREDSTFPGWKVWMTGSASGITSIAWKYSPEGSQENVLPGESKSLLSGFFNVVGGPFAINSTGKDVKTVTIYEAQDSAKDIFFVDENGTTHSVDLNGQINGRFGGLPNNQTSVSSWIDGYTFTLKCWEVADGSEAIKVNLTRGSDYDTVVITNGTPFNLNNNIGGGNVSNYELIANLSVGGTTKCADAFYNLTVLSFTALGGNPINKSLVYNMSGALSMANAWSNVSATGVNGTVTFTEADGKIIEVTYERGTIKTVKSDSSEITGTTTKYSVYGSKISKSSNLVIEYPDSSRHGRISVGRSGAVSYELTQGSYNSELDVTLASAAGSSVSINRIDVGLAKLDSEVASSSLDKPVILIGGWAVNSLVNELVSAGKIDTTELSMDRAMVKLIDNAFNSKSALVIAGYEGDDTRLAAQVVASQVLGTMNVLSGSSAILNTGVSSYSDVIVV